MLFVSFRSVGYSGEDSQQLSLHRRRRHLHRGGPAAIHDPGAIRRSVCGVLQMQHAQPFFVQTYSGLHAGDLSDAWHGRHD